MSEALSGADMAGVLALIEQAHQATTAYEFRQTLIHGVGAMIDSHSCVWTEFGVDLFDSQSAQTSVAEITDQHLDTEALLPIFNAYAWQHPVIANAINTHSGTRPIESLAISDLIDRDHFRALELYQHFYTHQSIEDQMSTGYIENDVVIGLSIHRPFWGFTRQEHRLLDQIAACTLSYYRTLCIIENLNPGAPTVQHGNSARFDEHHQTLGITRRQAEMLSLVARGKSNKQIAALCSVSEGTVRKHMENCFRRLSVNNRVSAVTTALAMIE